MTLPVTVLVVAKAPVPGEAKTRLADAVGAEAAAEIAALALLDTLDAVTAAPFAARVVAMTGDVDEATHCDEIRSALTNFVVIPQRGADFADRLANAHADTAAVAGPHPVLQIGMDTPQVTASLLERCGDALLAAPAVLGLAADGGWWVLGVHSPTDADVLRAVPMSTATTGAVTLRALRTIGLNPTLVEELQDVDTADDLVAVAQTCPPSSRFARAVLSYDAD